MAKGKRRNLTERYGIKAWIPNPKMIDIAEDRTGGMVCAFVNRGGHYTELATLARSCYMQGINDMVATLIQKDMLK